MKISETYDFLLECMSKHSKSKFTKEQISDILFEINIDGKKHNQLLQPQIIEECFDKLLNMFPDYEEYVEDKKDVKMAEITKEQMEEFIDVVDCYHKCQFVISKVNKLRANELSNSHDLEQ